MNKETWKHEYDRLNKLFHQLEHKNRHKQAEIIADRLSEMELTEPED